LYLIILILELDNAALVAFSQGSLAALEQYSLELAMVLSF